MCWALLLACAGCAAPLNPRMEGNHLSYEHAFTDAAAAAVRRDAEALCAQRREIAIRSSGVCSLTRCTTHYQCVTKADASRYGESQKK